MMAEVITGDNTQTTKLTSRYLLIDHYHARREFLHSQNPPVALAITVLTSKKPALYKKPCSKKPTPPPGFRLNAFKGAVASAVSFCETVLLFVDNALAICSDRIEGLIPTGLATDNASIG